MAIGRSHRRISGFWFRGECSGESAWFKRCLDVRWIEQENVTECQGKLGRYLFLKGDIWAEKHEDKGLWESERAEEEVSKSEAHLGTQERFVAGVMCRVKWWGRSQERWRALRESKVKTAFNLVSSWRSLGAHSFFVIKPQVLKSGSTRLC